MSLGSRSGLLGEEFMPQLDEKDITVTNFRVPSASIDQSTQMQLQIENTLKTLPEVALVFSKNGNADLGTDPMPPMTTIAIRLRESVAVQTVGSTWRKKCT